MTYTSRLQNILWALCLGTALFLAILHVWNLAGGNRQAIDLLRRASSFNLPWVRPAWWQTTCVPRVGSVRPWSHNALWDAHGLILSGACQDAVERLESVVLQATAVDQQQVVLAYTYSMLGNWRAASEIMPISQLLAGNWPVRRYWGNVLLRAGVAPGADSALLLEAERLLDTYRPNGSLTLARFWQARNDPVAAFEEFRRALVGMEDADVFALVGEYETVRRDYVIAMSARRPADSQWQRLALKNQRADGAHGDTDPDPLYVLDHVLPDGRRLVGLTPDADDLILGPLVRVTFYLLESDMLTTETRWVRNRMPDAGFAWGEPVAGVRPFGYGARYGVKLPYPFRVERHENRQYVCLDHGTNNVLHSGLESPSLPIASQVMVMVGSYLTDSDGKATVGVRWSGGEDAVMQQHLVVRRSTAVWRSFAAVLSAPAQAKLVSGYMLQYQSTGRACFDDVLLFSLDMVS